MRLGNAIAVATFAVVIVGASGALVACFDLLHSTADVRTACELDASYPGCTVAEKVETDFCSFTQEEARHDALHACAWLGACESPMGNNAFGPCYFRALLAYDCAANPNHRAQSAAHDLWDCLRQVKTCGDVDACVFKGGAPSACGGPGVYTGCSPDDPDVRVLCADHDAGPPARGRGENCALWGQTCAPAAGGTVCAGEPTGLACKSGCESTSLHWCAGGEDGGPQVDRGIDCASNGAMACGGFPSPGTAQWVACRPESDAAACEPSASATCDDGRAVMCPAGVTETLDCATLLGSPDACGAGALSPPFDWTSACTMNPPACTSDSCNGGVLTSCERGAAFWVSCTGEGLGECRMATVEPGATPRAACGPPAP
jgi:hypothetical protein